MRSVWFALVGPAIGEVEKCLSRNGFEKLSSEAGRWNYPPGSDAILYVSCGGYDWVQEWELEEEYQELLQAINGKVPTVHITADVSGRHPGDEEVRFLARVLLRNFEGYGFDDYLSYSHAWTLDEIESDVLVDGQPFFDYQGWRKVQRRNDQEQKELAERRKQVMKQFGNSSDDDTLREMVRAGIQDRGDSQNSDRKMVGCLRKRLIISLRSIDSMMGYD